MKKFKGRDPPQKQTDLRDPLCGAGKRGVSENMGKNDVQNQRHGWIWILEGRVDHAKKKETRTEKRAS